LASLAAAVVDSGRAIADDDTLGASLEMRRREYIVVGVLIVTIAG